MLVADILKSDTVQKILMLGVIALLGFMLVKQCKTEDAILWQMEQNRRALHDSTKVIKNKVDELMWVKYNLATSLEDLKKYDSAMYLQVKNVGMDVKDVKRITSNYDWQGIKDLITEHKSGYVNGMAVDTINWKLKDTVGSLTRDMAGYAISIYDTTKRQFVGNSKAYLNKYNFGVQLYTFTTVDKDGHFMTAVKPAVPTPGLSFDVKSADISDDIQDLYNKSKKDDWWFWGLGITAGYGYGIAPKDGTVVKTPFIGIGGNSNFSTVFCGNNKETIR